MKRRQCRTKRFRFDGGAAMLFNKNTKYHSKKVLCDGIAFDSKAERDYYL